MAVPNLKIEDQFLLKQTTKVDGITEKKTKKKNKVMKIY